MMRIAILFLVLGVLLAGCIGESTNADVNVTPTPETVTPSLEPTATPVPIAPGERHLYLNTADMMNPQLEEQMFRVEKKYADQLWAQDLNVTKNCKRIKSFYSECVPDVQIYANETLVGTTDEFGLIDVYDFFCVENYGKEFELSFEKGNYWRCISPVTHTYSGNEYPLVDLSHTGNNTFKCPEYMIGNISFNSKNSHEYIAEKEALMDVGTFPRVVTIWQDDDADVSEFDSSTGDYSVYVMVALCDYPKVQ